MFGEVSAEQLVAAQGTIADVLRFIVDNKDSDDKDKKSAARAAMALICLDSMMTHSIITSLAKDISKSIEREKGLEEEKEEPRQTKINIPIVIQTGNKS